MAWIIEILNPFEPFNVQKQEADVGSTILNWVENKYPETREFPTPTICLLNGAPLMRKDWNYVIQDRDVINFIAVQGWSFVIAIVIAIVVAVATVLLTPVPTQPGDTAASDPVFSIKGQSNSIRLGEPIETNYGRNRIFPSYAARPYFQYQNNDQFQFSLFCIGHGQYEIHEVQIGDTAIANYQEAEYEIVPPGSVVALFPTNVYTAPEAGGQMLFASNQEEFTGDGWVGPFPANPSGTSASQIQIDLVYPKGLYSMDKKGNIGSVSIRVEAQRRLIDDVGAPLGVWESLDGSPYFEVSGATTTPQRRTFSADVDPGRYEVRVRRITAFDDSSRAGNEVRWEGMRSSIDIVHDYGEVTLLAVKIRASNNLNDRTAQRFNVIATRKLPMKTFEDSDANSDGWTEPIPTRSIVWAFVDVFRGLYGGRIVEDTFFDWDTLIALDALYESRDEHFDWSFRDPITVWDAARTIARTGRAIPLLAGSLITMKRDGPTEIPVTLFNHENIVEGSFEWAVKLWDLDEFDSARIEYTDPSTGYKQETVMAILPGDTSDHPEDIRLMGIQDRTHAYREGLYILASRRYLRENVSFTTGLEGYIPTFGDLILVSHDVPKWGQAGYVVEATRGAGSTYHLWLSEPLDWTGTGEHHILLRGKRSEVIGPVIAQQTSDPQQVVIESVADIDFLLTGKTEPMLFLFGVIGEVTKLMKVVRIEPQGEETIKVSAVNDAPAIYTFDSLIPPPLEATPYAPIPPDLPVIAQLILSLLDGPLSIVQASWTAAFGAQSYVVQTSADGENWQERARVTRTSIQLPTIVGVLYVRVAAINEGQGPWIADSITITPVSGLGLSIPWEFLEWGVSWFEVLNSMGWEVKVYDNMESEPALKRTETLSISGDRLYGYDYAKAVADGNLVREMLVTVDALFEEEEGGGSEPSGFPASMALSNSIPLAPTSPASVINSFDSSEVIYQLTWLVPEEDDLIRIKLWVSAVNGFDPAVTAPLLDVTLGSPGWAGLQTSLLVHIALDSDGQHAEQYWRVALFDVWGSELSSNVTAQQTIPAFA